MQRLLRCVVVGLLLMCVALSAVILSAGKVKSFGKAILTVRERDKSILTGDLYALSYLEAFQEKIKETKLKERFPCADKPIVIMGDSFFNTGFDSDPVPNALERQAGIKLCYRATSRQELSPTEYVKMMGRTDTSRSGIFVWETIERKSLERALALTSLSNQDGAPLKKREDSRWESIRHLLFDRVDVEYMLKNNRFTKPLNVWLRNTAFAWFGDTNPKTPVYSLNPPMLFMDEEVAFHENVTKFISLEKAADAIAREARTLQKKYNLTLLYVVIPDKFSLYGDLTGAAPYDQYIPRLLAALRQRNVHTLDLHRIFADQKRKNPGKLLYYAGDTHYTPTGKQLLLEELIKILDSLSNNTDNAKRDT